MGKSVDRFNLASTTTARPPGMSVAAAVWRTIACHRYGLSASGLAKRLGNSTSLTTDDAGGSAATAHTNSSSKTVRSE
jgi:hypothetical protein